MATKLFERELTTLIQDAGYAAAALIDDAVEVVRELPGRVEGEVKDVREDAPAFVKDLPNKARATADDLQADLKTRVEKYRGDVEGTIKDVRTRANKELEERVAAFEKAFDARATEGRKVVDTVLHDERVKPLVDRVREAEGQVKDLFTKLTKRDETAEATDVAVDVDVKAAS